MNWQPRTTMMKKPSTRRRGMAVIEVLVAVAVLSVVLGLAARMAVATSAVRNRVEKQRVLLEAKTNLMSHAMAIPFEDVKKERLEVLAKEIDPNGNWQIGVEDVATDLSGTGKAARKISIELLGNRGNDAGSDRKNPGRAIVAWRFPVDENRTAVGGSTVSGANDDGAEE